MPKYDYRYLVERVKATKEYQAILDLGLEDVTTEKNARRGSIFFRTCLPAGKKFYEYSMYTSGYLRIYNPSNDNREYGLSANCRLEGNHADSVKFSQYIDMLKKLPRIYNRKAKKEGLFKEQQFLDEIEDVDLPKHLTHKWKFSLTKQLFLNRLKNQQLN